MIISKKYFNHFECLTILDFVKSNQQKWKLFNREYEYYAIDYSLETMWLFEKLSSFFEENINLKIKKLKPQIHFHKFKEGDWFGKHNDIRDNRAYAVGVLLNDNFDGGDFKFYNPTEQTLNKIVGNTYLFDVRIEHEITPITKGERYSLLWFLQNEHIKFQTNKLI